MDDPHHGSSTPLLRGDAPNLVPLGLGEPQVAIGPDRDALRPATGRGNGECGEAARGGEAPDGVPLERGEPQVAVRPGRDELRPVQGRWGGESRDAAIGSDTPEDVGPSGEPQIAIRPGGDAERVAAARGDIELGDSAGCGPGGSAAQAQQADTGNYSCEKCSQVRPPFSTVHIASSFR